MSGDTATLPAPGDGAGGVSSYRQRLDVLLCAALAAATSVAVVWLVPTGGDLAAHVYRASLVRHGILVWDNLWYAGQYPLSSYSLLYSPLASLVGNTTLGVGGAVLAAALFASVAQREWRALGRWPARAFAVLLAGQVFTAAYPFDAGLAMLLGTLWALQRGRTWLAVPFMLLTLGFSPLAFLFLAVALAALFLARRRLSRQTLILAAIGAVAGGLQLALLVLLPTPSLVFPYGIWRLLAGLVVAALGTALALQSRRAGWPMASIFLVWSVASVVFELVPSPVGRNILRASLFAGPLMLVAAGLAHWRPRRLAVTAVAVAFAANMLPYAAMIPARSSDASASASFWQPLIAFLKRHNPPDFRVEVVETANHWENYFLPAAGIPLARGWYVQLDLADNPALYKPTLSAAAYRSWLRVRAVRYVVLPHLPAETASGGHEAALLRGGRSGLRAVYESPAVTVYELPHATPLLTGPAHARIDLLGHSRIEGRVARPGNYLLRVTYNPYWSVLDGSLCVSRAGSGLTRLHATRAGPFTLKAIESPHRLLDTILAGRTATCADAG